MKEHDKEHFRLIGQNLLKARKEKGLSQQELANRCSVERAKISKIENGANDFKHSSLLEIARGLNVDIRDLVPSSK